MKGTSTASPHRIQKCCFLAISQYCLSWSIKDGRLKRSGERYWVRLTFKQNNRSECEGQARMTNRRRKRLSRDNTTLRPLAV